MYKVQIIGSNMIPDLIKSIITGENGPLSREELVLGESMKALEFAIFNELNECLLEFDNKGKVDPELARITAELQCALDIVQSARTKEERKRVYEILKSLGKFPQ